MLITFILFPIPPEYTFQDKKHPLCAILFSPRQLPIVLFAHITLPLRPPRWAYNLLHDYICPDPESP